MVNNITILGSTGSIGKNALEVIAMHPDKYSVYALTANTDVDTLEEQCIKWQPRYAVMRGDDAAAELTQRLKNRNINSEVLSGISSLELVASDQAVTTVIAAIVGSAGLLPTLSAAKAGKRILLANKEALVMSGSLFMNAVRKNEAMLLPVDSEHNAIFQCMPERMQGSPHDYGVEKILLTASGGPFRTIDIKQLEKVSPEIAVKHPNWSMGPKISIDSATMMNKGLEVIEAHWLFNIPVEKIEVVIHPQSVIHSMVSYNDGSVLAQLGNPDMRTPIANALAWPNRINSGVEPLDIFSVATLDFEEPDLERFPCLGLCYEAIKMGGTGSTILNAANEVAVEAFLNKQISFTRISQIIEDVLNNVDIDNDLDDLEVILEADRKARLYASKTIRN